MTILKFLITFATVTVALLSGNAPMHQHSSELPAFSNDKPQAETKNLPAVNPLEIKRLIDESRRTSKKSAIVPEVNLVPTWKTLSIDPRFLESCGGGNCEAELDRADLDDQLPDEVILKISDFHFCRFLVFTPSGSSDADKARWKFRGHVDWDFNKYEMARHRIVRANGRPWLVIRAQAGSGTGFALYHETFYELTSEGLRSVLSYPIEGQTYPWLTGLGRSFRAKVQPGTNGELMVVYEVDYEAVRYADKKSSRLARNRHRVCYTWHNDKRVFGFSPECSDTSEVEISAIANIETGDDDEGEQIGNMKFYSMSEERAFVGGGYDVFLKYNFPALMKIANSNSEAERDWLRHFLKDCNDTPKKAELLDALVKK